MRSPVVLVGDVGGTSVRFALGQKTDAGITLTDIKTSSNPNIQSFSEAVQDYLKQIDAVPDMALFALAGPVRDDEVKLTNRDWPLVSANDLKASLGIEKVWLRNDFAAMARAIPELPESQFENIIPGNSTTTSKPVLVTGPGTGFGISSLLPEGQGWRVVTGEGGHAAFAPRTDEEKQLHAVMTATHGYVSYEMMVSGRWLIPVYEALCSVRGRPVEKLNLQEMLQAASQGDDFFNSLFQIRANILMGAIGDAALIAGTPDRIVMTGSVAVGLLPWLNAKDACVRLHERGVMSDFFKPTTVDVLTSGEAPLIGAAAIAFDQP